MSLSLGAIGSCVICDFDSPCNIYLSFVTRCTCNTKQPSQPKLKMFGVHLHLGLLRGLGPNVASVVGLTRV